MSDLIAITCAQCENATSKHKLAWIRVDQGGNAAALCSWECALRFVRKLRLAESLILDGYDVPPPWRGEPESIEFKWLRHMEPGSDHHTEQA